MRSVSVFLSEVQELTVQEPRQPLSLPFPGNCIDSTPGFSFFQECRSEVMSLLHKYLCPVGMPGMGEDPTAPPKLGGMRGLQRTRELGVYMGKRGHRPFPQAPLLFRTEWGLWSPSSL